MDLSAALGSGTEFHGIVYRHCTGEDAVEFALDQLFADARKVIDKEHALEVVAFVLYNAGKETADFFAVFVEILVEPCQKYMLYALHILADTGQAKAAFGTRYHIAVENLDFRVDKCQFAACAFGEAIANRVGIDYNQADIAADLGRGKADAFRLIHCVEHLGNKVFEALGIFLERFVLGAEYRMSVKIYR